MIMIENWTKTWAKLREPLTELPVVGEAGPWIFLVLMALLAEFLADRFAVPWLESKGREKFAKALSSQADGLRAGVIVAAFSSATTMEKESAIVGLIVGAALPLVKLGRDQLMAGMVLLGVLLGGCGRTRTPTEEVSRQVCLVTAEKEAKDRGDRECIDAGLGWNECSDPDFSTPDECAEAGETWSLCPHRQDIMADLAEAQEKCR